MGLIEFFKKLFRTTPKKLKIGYALGSGGAKGFATLGVIKALEENGIYPDVVTGTSIGSIIGAFLSDGYSSTDIFEMLKTVDASEITNFFMLKMDTFGLSSVIARFIGDKKIEELKIPFGAVATEYESGEEKDFTSGNVSEILCASSSFPPFFKPQVIDGVKYIDGAFCNSVPSDLALSLGADFVIGVDLSVRENKSGIVDKLLPSYKGKTATPWDKGYKYSDVILHPDLSLYRSTSFKSAYKMFELGYQTAMSKMQEIKEKIKAKEKGLKKKK